MKSVIIVAHALEIGGAERALLGLLESFDYSQFEVDLFLMRHTGELFDLIPKEVHLLPEIKQYTGLAVPMVSILHKGMWKVVSGRLYAKIKAKHYIKKNHVHGENTVELDYSHKYSLKAMPMISKKKYNMAISFLTPHYYAVHKVHADKRVAWIHTDYSYMGVDVKSEKKMWEAYDNIVSISEACTRGFLSKFPELEQKIVEIENIIAPNFIRKQADMLYVDDEMATDDGELKILSIGRFSTQKNFDNIPDICRRICQNGIKIKWFLIGFGQEEEHIRQKIYESGMEKNVVILGKKSNPYPYIKACDVYIQPSLYEGKCVAVREAQILGKPVIITRYPTASSQLRDGVDGLIVPLDNEKCAEALTNILSDNDKMDMLRENVKSIDYSNTSEIEKIYSLFE